MSHDVSLDAWTRLWESWRMPLSGNVNHQITTPWFSPAITVNYSGNTAVEQRVVTEVAGYGRQLGWLSEIVAALAQDKPVPEASLEKLRKAMAKIDTIKSEVAADQKEATLEALEKFKSEAGSQDYISFLRSELAKAGQAST